MSWATESLLLFLGISLVVSHWFCTFVMLLIMYVEVAAGKRTFESIDNINACKMCFIPFYLVYVFLIGDEKCQ